jgi:hypothetical protein
MDFISKLKDLRTGQVFKLAGLALLIAVVLGVAVRLIVPAFNSVGRGGFGGMVAGLAPQSASKSMGLGMAEMDMAYADEAVGLSVRNVAGSNIAPSPEPPADGTVGSDAEDYEVTEYYGQVETRDLEGDCQQIKDLKGFDYVIFEHASEQDKRCYYRFKVAVANVDSVLAVINAMDPKELTKNTQTIKKLLEDYTSQQEILEKKLWNVEQTLEDAVASYDQITDVATDAADAESLAKIIESKLRILERLTNERININAQLERLARSKAEQLDRLEYTRFNLTIRENKFVDGEQIGDSWKAAVKQFVFDVNRIAQDVSIRLVAVILTILQWALYLLIAVVALKYGWQAAKWIWKK